MKILEFEGLKIFKEKIIALLSNHVNNSDIHMSEQERYRINNFPTKLSSFENDMNYITLGDFIKKNDYDGGNASNAGIVDEKELDGGDAVSTAE